MLRKLRSSVEKKDGTKDRTNISQYFSSGCFFMSHPQRRDFLYQLLQYRMQISIRGNNMMPFYKILIPIKVSHPTTGFQHQQCSSRIIPFADESFRPSIKTSGGYIAYCQSCRTSHTDTTNLTIQIMYQMFSRTGILT